MPIIQSAIKALRRDRRRNVVNRNIRSQMTTAIDKVHAQPSVATLSVGYQVIDRAAKKNIIHSNKAARLKSQLQKFVTKAASGPVAMDTSKAPATKAKKKIVPKKRPATSKSKTQ